MSRAPDSLPDPEQLLAELKQNSFPPHIAELSVTNRIKRAFTLYEHCAATQPWGLFPVIPRDMAAGWKKMGYTTWKLAPLSRIFRTHVWWCVFFGPFWYFAVRMWRKGLLLLGAALPVAFVVYGLCVLITGLPWKEMPLGVELGFEWGFGYLVGLMAPYDLYRLKVKKEVFWW